CNADARPDYERWPSGLYAKFAFRRRSNIAAANLEHSINSRFAQFDTDGSAVPLSFTQVRSAR
ncbi:MAG: hypothetical protein WA020_06660, partial [Candidatus Acidiferrales bacterium]